MRRINARLLTGPNPHFLCNVILPLSGIYPTVQILLLMNLFHDRRSGQGFLYFWVQTSHNLCAKTLAGTPFPSHEQDYALFFYWLFLCFFLSFLMVHVWVGSKCEETTQLIAQLQGKGKWEDRLTSRKGIKRVLIFGTTCGKSLSIYQLLYSSRCNIYFLYVWPTKCHERGMKLRPRRPAPIALLAIRHLHA